MPEANLISKKCDYPFQDTHIPFDDACAMVKDKNHSVSHFKDWSRQQYANKGIALAYDGVPKTAVSDFVAYLESLKTLEIDESNFDQYFFDTRKHKPKPGQVLACYESMADLVDGNLKRDIIHLLMTKEQTATRCVALLQKLAGATDKSAVKVVKEMMTDLLSGKSTDEVAAKPYELQCRYYYYCYKQCMPTDDPRWWSTSLIDVRFTNEDGSDFS